jgi:CRP-like cAMP-binding protein
MKKVLFLFGELNDLDVDWLISHGKEERSAQGTVLIQQGKPTDALYIVLEGAFVVKAAGAKDPVGNLGPGEIVGEMSFIDSRPPSTTVQASAHSVVYSIPRTSLSAQLKADTGFAARFYRALSMFLSYRLRKLTLRMAEGPRDVPEAESPDELDSQVLDGVYMAGKRFQRLLQGLGR